MPREQDRIDGLFALIAGIVIGAIGTLFWVAVIRQVSDLIE